MTGIVINVEVRDRTGTGGARQTRREGLVPGILYGGGKDPVAIAASSKELLKAIRSGKFLAHMVDLHHSGESQPVIPRDVQWDPITDMPVHFDLYRVEEGSVISVDVPVHFLNQDTCPGIKKGGTLNVVRHTVALDVPAGKIPEELVIDLAGRDIGDVIHTAHAQPSATATSPLRPSLAAVASKKTQPKKHKPFWMHVIKAPASSGAFLL
jgi:large subunit ribosomal protein L25